jgi:type I restriction enzyme S subunit
MGSEWRIGTLRDALGEKGYIRGPFGSALRRPELKTNGIPVYEQQHAITGTREFRFYIDEQKYQSMKRFAVQPDDLIVSCSGTLARVSMICSDDPIGIISQALLILRPDKTVVWPKYLYYFMSSKRGYDSLTGVSTGSVQVNIARRSIIEKTELPLPPLPEQHAIAHILGSLDDKIELNHRMNQTLQAMARAIFKHWFIDFEFPNENGEPYKSSGGETINSPLGPIPKGWRIGRIEDVCEFSYGKALKADKRIQGRIPVYGSNGQIGWHNESLVSGPGIIVGRKGNPGLIHWSKEDFFPIDTTFYVVPRVGKSIMHFLYFALKHVDLPRLSADSAVPGLNRNIAYMQQLVIPTEQLLRDFENRISIIFDLLQTNCWQNQSLSELRDSLLPKLVSGEIRVPVSEKEDDQL